MKADSDHAIDMVAEIERLAALDRSTTTSPASMLEAFEVYAPRFLIRQLPRNAAPLDSIPTRTKAKAAP